MKAAPQAAQTAIMNLQKLLVRDPTSNTRRYWTSSASFIKVAETGYVAFPM
jgi:hypothetical protein